MKRFFETSISIYAQEVGLKGDSARALIAQGGIISVQVMNEFANVTKRKFKRHWSEIEAALLDIEVVVAEIRPLTLELHRLAIMIAHEHNMSFYDTLIAAAAIEADCEILLSEDLQHGRKFGNLAVVNPFI